MKRMIAQTMNRRKIELLAAVLAFIRLEYDRLGLELTDLRLQVHDALQMLAHCDLVLLDLSLLLFHARQQIAFDRVYG